MNTFSRIFEEFDNSALLGLNSIFLSFFIFIIIFCICIFIFNIIITWKMFEKAGRPGWYSIIPVYNKIILLEIIGYKWYYLFLFYVVNIPYIGPIVQLLFTLTLNMHLAKSFDQSKGFGIGLWLVNPIFTAIIAFNKDINYVGTTVDGDIDFNDLF